MSGLTHRLRLVPPSVRHRDSFLAAVREFQAEGLPWWTGRAIDLAGRDFAGFVAGKLAEAEHGTEARPPKTHRWAVVNDQFVGRIAIFHHLTDALRESGGHIGYDTRPSMRGRGLATAMLREALPIARELGLAEVLLTCDETNAASVHVIERNGGVQIDARALVPGRPRKLYFRIDL